MHYVTHPRAQRQQVFLACILTPLVLIALGCGQEDKTITSSSSRFEVDDDRSSAPPAGTSSAPDRADRADRANRADRDTPQPSPANGSDAPPAGVAQGSAPQQPPSIPQTALDDFAVPDGTPEELWSFIEDVSRREPRGRTQQEILRSVQEIMSARIGAAEKILEHSDATTEQRRNSVEVKLATLQELMSIGVVEAEGHFQEFCRALVNDQDPEIARYGRLLNFALDVNEVVTNEEEDVEGIVTRARELLAEEVVDNETFQYVRASALELLQGGYPAEGQQIVDELVTAFADESDEQIRRDVNSLPEEAFFLRSELPQKLTNFVQRQPESLEPLRAATRQLLNQDRMGTTALQQSIFIADAMERHGETEAAREVYARVTEVFGSSDDEEAARLATEATETADRRLGMVGQPFSLTGQLNDGTDLNWEEFQDGKVVLVTFWSIENRAYVQQEIPQIKKLVELYADRGFQVIGVNVDEEPELLQQFFRFQSVPWPNVMDGTAGEGQMIKQVGVATIPFNILIDREGNVAALHLNSQTLPEKLLDVLN